VLGGSDSPNTRSEENVTHATSVSSARHHATTWSAYWDGLTDRQRHFREESAEYVRNLAATGWLHAGACVLDFGCGFGHVADGVAPLVGELSLYDASANMRCRAAVTVARHRNIRFLDFFPPRSVAGPAPRFDLILVNSVVQYMTPDEFSRWLERWRDLLAPGGRIVVSDIIPPEHAGLWEIFDLLRFSARRGFLLTALWQAVGELGPYGRIRKAHPLTRFDTSELTRRAAAADLTVAFLPRNLTYFPRRITAAFTRREAS
jgi:cyclopropane fatty-acyl-phospholipid synthase-like methyltransferase